VLSALRFVVTRFLQAEQLKSLLRPSACCDLQAQRTARSTRALCSTVWGYWSAHLAAKHSKGWESTCARAVLLCDGEEALLCDRFSLGFSVAKCTQEILTDFHNNAKFKTSELGLP